MAEKSQSILICKDLKKKIGKKEILKGISLNVNQGDILGFIGPNGAGKTTTIKLILGLQNITSGTVEINGYDIQKNFTKAISRVGTIVESPDLYMYMTGYDNLKIIANLYPDIDSKRIDEVVKLVGLENRIHDKVSKYSLGMRQRLGIAQSILHNPNLLILDEPTNGLDPEGIKQVRNLLIKLASTEKMGILISSHNLLELESFCNKITIIKNGEIVENSSIEDARKINGNTIYIFELDNNKNISSLIKNQTEVIDNENIKIYASREEIPSIIKVLVENNVKIYKVYEETGSLEEAFLKKTGGNIID